MKVIRKFCSKKELVLLRDIAANLCHTDGGRPGIYKCGTTYSLPGDLYNRMLVASELPGPILIGNCYRQFISYEKNGWIHPHKDWVHENCKLYRVNVLVDAPIKGGECFVDGVEVVLKEGDALVLRSELEEHEVKKILEGKRMIFTIGFHHKGG
jgi:hypothetical protein